MNEWLVVVVGVAIVAAIVLLAKARAEKSLARDGRTHVLQQGGTGLVSDSPADVPQQRTFTANMTVDSGDLSKLPDVAQDAVRAAMTALGESGIRVSNRPHINIKTNIKTVFKTPNEEMADAIAAREREKGMAVEITPPAPGETQWKVTAEKPSPT